MRRLWLAAGALAMVVCTFIIGNQLIVGDRAITRSGLGLDFTAFYAAGTFTRQHRVAELYDLPAIAAEEHRIAQANNLELHSAFGPYWNPPVVAWVFAPLSALPYQTALNLWLSINAIALGAALWLLAQMLPPDEVGRTRHRWLLVILVPLSMPAIQALSHGQNTCISLLIVTGVVTLWRKAGRGTTRAVLAGALAGLLAYKPQLAAVIGGVLILDLGWAALAGMACTGVLLLVATLITMPGMLELYLHRLPAILHFMQVEHPYLWDRHATLTAFWRLLFQGTGAGETILIAQSLTVLTTLALAGLLCRMLWASRDSLQLLRMPWHARARELTTTKTPGLYGATGAETTPVPLPGSARDRVIAATIAAMPLLMPFYFDYDLLLLAVPATLFAAEMMNSRTPRSGADRWLIRSWTCLYLWLFFNPALARLTHFNLTVILLSIVATLLILRAIRKRLPLVFIGPTSYNPTWDQG